MSLIDVTDVSALGAGASLDDIALESVIDREEAELVRRFGAHYTTALATVTQTRPGGAKSLMLTRAIGSVTSVSEYTYLGDTLPRTLVVNTDYVVWADQGRIERLGGVWGPRVTVVFVPADDTQLRAQVLIELVRIAVAQSAYKEEMVKGVEDSYSYVAAKDWDDAREAQYARLLMSHL